MHGELQHAVSEKESMELKLQEYAQSILHYEETVALKEQEKIELVKSYQNLSQEAEKLNSHLQKVQGDSSSVKMDLVTVSQVRGHVILVNKEVRVSAPCHWYYRIRRN